MNIIKILTDIMKRREKQDSGRYMYGVHNDYVYYSPDGFVMYRIPEKRFYLDTKKVFKDVEPFTVEKIFKPNDAHSAIKTGEFKSKLDQYGKKNYIVTKIKSDSVITWINDSYLSNFAPDCEFFVTSRYGAVYIMENGDFVGLIMPVKMEDSDYD